MYSDSDFDESDGVDSEAEMEWCGISPEEIILEEDVYTDFVINIAVPNKNILSKSTTICWAGFIMISALYVQTLFIVWMIPMISHDEWTSKTNVEDWGNNSNLFVDWRIKGGNETFEDAPWAYWVCTGQEFSWTESVVDNLSKYAEIRTLLGFKVPAGIMFGLLAVILWALQVLQYLRRCANFAMLLLVKEDDCHAKLELWTLGVKLTVFVISIVRIGLTVKLGYTGVLFLVHTDNLKDFILNCVALGFVYDVPAYFYHALATNSSKKNIDKALKKMPSAHVPTCLSYSSGLISFFLMVVVVFLAWGSLQKFGDTLTGDVYKKLCAQEAYFQYDDAGAILASVSTEQITK